MDFGIDTRLVLLAAGLMFLWALALGVVKYRQIVASPTSTAHPYTDIAHRAALLYSFAMLLVATFVELSSWPTFVNATAASLLVVFFVAPVAIYMQIGLQSDMANQWVDPPKGTHPFMFSLIFSEMASFGVLLAGFVKGHLL
jgi:hypothetical protein